MNVGLGGSLVVLRAVLVLVVCVFLVALNVLVVVSSWASTPTEATRVTASRKDGIFIVAIDCSEGLTMLEAQRDLGWRK